MEKDSLEWRESNAKRRSNERGRDERNEERRKKKE